MSAELHVVKRVSFLNVPEQLRMLAQRIEDDPIVAASVVLILGRSDGRVSILGYGERTSGLEVTGWIHRGLTYMSERSGVDEQNLGPVDIA